MKKKLVYKMFMPLLILLMLVFGITFLLVNYMSNTNVKKLISNINMEYIDKIIIEEETKERVMKSLLSELDDNYLKQARLVAEIIKDDPSYLEIDNLKKLANYVELDEIYIMNQNGIIEVGTDEKNIGFDFKSSEQTLPFMQIIKDPEFELAQDYQQRGADKELYKYVGVRRLDKPGIVQVGVRPHKINWFIKNTGIKNYFEKIENNKTLRGYILDESGRILYSTSNVDQTGVIKEDIFIKLIGNKGNFVTSKGHLVNYKGKNGEIYVLEDTLENANQTMNRTSLYLLGIYIIALIILFLSMYSLTKHYVLKAIFKFISLFKKASEGNLSIRSDIRSKDEMNVMGENFNAFMEIFETLILQIRNGGQAILGSSEEMSRANEDLAKKTAVQANVLQRTSATMEQISKIVKINTEKTKEANKITETAREKAEIVATLSNDLKISMDSINKSSKKIENIIDVIEEIAFQTNLLALNAAVEAARAGEQGRGFAVVASEVRNLAQRSGKAAKEIKEKIKDSVEKVDEGNLLVENTIVSLDKIVGEINSINDVIYEITKGAKEQADGILDMNQAIADIDANIQVNATISEENSAAASVLYNQAKEFLNFVDFFKISSYEDFDLETIRKENTSNIRKVDEAEDMIPFDEDIEEI